jgi:hypothetical protein
MKRLRLAIQTGAFAELKAELRGRYREPLTGL